MSIPFDNTYARLPVQFFQSTALTPVAAPRLVQLNRLLAAELGLDADELAGPAGINILSGSRIAAGAQPIALAYAGHQFGHFVPQLGDGRALLLGEVIDRHGCRRDIQLKGSGPTAFSRRGDGRAALGPVLREYIISEAMAALRVPTTRSLAAVLTGETVQRDQLLPGAVLTRVAASHIRIGTFQFFAARGDTDGLRILADYVIQRHYPAAAASPRPYLALLEAVIAAQAALVAQWQAIGFIHGVMNTDNMSIAGETIDYGPCAFMDSYDPATVFSSIDRAGRYAYGNQPPIAQWNLARLAEALLPLIAEEPAAAIELAERAIHAFPAVFETAYLARMRAKLGLLTAQDGDAALVKGLLTAMTTDTVDFTLAFRRLCDAGKPGAEVRPVRDLFTHPALFDAWLVQWRHRLAQEPRHEPHRRTAMLQANPLYIPRNHKVEAAIEAAVADSDFAPFERLLTVLANPYADQPLIAEYAEPPPAGQGIFQTFCGT